MKKLWWKILNPVVKYELNMEKSESQLILSIQKSVTQIPSENICWIWELHMAWCSAGVPLWTGKHSGVHVSYLRCSQTLPLTKS